MYTLKRYKYLWITLHYFWHNGTGIINKHFLNYRVDSGRELNTVSFNNFRPSIHSLDSYQSSPQILFTQSIKNTVCNFRWMDYYHWSDVTSTMIQSCDWSILFRILKNLNSAHRIYASCSSVVSEYKVIIKTLCLPSKLVLKIQV